MKVMILTHGMTGGGGSEKVMANLSLALHDRFEFVFVTPELIQDHDAHTFPYHGKLIQTDMKWLDPAESSFDRVKKFVYRIKRLRETILQEAPDVVLSNFSYMWHAVMMLLKVLGVFRGHMVLRFGNPVSMDLEQRGRIYYVLNWLAVRVASRVVANSHGLANDIITYLKAPPDKVVTIHNPIPLDRIGVLSNEAVSDRIFDQTAPVILSVGRFTMQKNFTMLLSAFSRIQGQTGAKLALVGSGPQEEELKGLANELEITEHVVFLGWQENPYRFMSRASVLVLCSDFEGFPSTLVEAMACGCPVIATDCPYGPREILDNGKYGLLVPVGNEAALADTMNGILSDKELRTRLSRLGYQRALEYDAKVTAEQYAALFAETSQEIC